MSEMQQYSAGASSGGLTLGTKVAITRTVQRGIRRAACVEAEGAVADVKMFQVAQLGASAMFRASYLSALEQSLVETTPAASARVAFMADAATQAMGEVIQSTASRLRRM